MSRRKKTINVMLVVAMLAVLITFVTPIGSQTVQAASGAFVKGINMNGNAVTVDGNQWVSYSTALSSGFSTTAGKTYNNSITWVPATDSGTNTMLNTVIYQSGGSFTMNQTLANGSYDVYFYLTENYKDNYRSEDIKLEGTTVATGVGKLTKNTWAKYGPYKVTVSDGSLSMDFVRVSGDPQIAGLAIFESGTGGGSSEGLVAFPGAEGYGKNTTGGRGGAVYEVTNLNSSGTGSFGAAISASGPRTIVFRVSGTITGNYDIKNGDITIAGQTAPGDGITIKGRLSINADNIIIRHIRVRNDPVANPDGDALGGRFHKNIIIDHVSASWSTDEVLSLYHNDYTTVQWSLIAEALPKGTTDDHRFGAIWGNNYGTWHHNLIADNASRNPRWASGSGYNDYRNNVLYNWQYQSSYGGEAQQVGDSRFTFSTINMVANYYKPGPATEAAVARRIVEPTARSTDDKGSWYVSGNYVEGYPDVTADNWKGVDGSDYIKLSTPWNAMPINQQSPQDAYTAVLDKSGASLKRDKVDVDIIDGVRNGTGKYGNNGIISNPSDVGGWPTLNSAPAPVDSDHDGMPDNWETAHNLNPNNASDRNNKDAVGYTMLELYLSSLSN
ncbi:pectate lyase family protein [Paenibacillus ferrarius]|uniref:pectate lyase family protein n=1 Tax=Paenibacillus ferrarius TaxID=1469647 RepID=UPI003D297DB5